MTDTLFTSFCRKSGLAVKILTLTTLALTLLCTAPYSSFSQAPDPSFSQAPDPSFSQAPDPSFSQAPALGQSVTIFGLTESNTLVRLSQDGTAQKEIAIQGLLPNENAMSIDQRPCPCEMFVLTNKARLLRLNPDTGQTTVNATTPQGITADAPFYNIEVGPARPIDDVTIISGVNGISGANGLSTFKFSTVATSIPSLNMRPSPRFAAIDSNAGRTPQLGAIAYSNNFLRSPSSPLIGIDIAQGVLVNVNEISGEVSTIGTLGTQVSQVFGFDIGASENTSGNVNAQAYAVLSDASSPSSQGVYSVDVVTGRVTRLGTYNGGSRIRDIAIALGGEFVLFPSQPQPTSTWRVPVLENAGFFDVVVGRVNRGRPNPDPTTVLLNVSTPSKDEPGAAVGTDFSLPESRFTYLLSFRPDEFEKTFRIALNNDALPRGNRGLTLRLQEPTNGAVLGAVSEARVVIVDDETGATGGLSSNITTLSLRSERISLRRLLRSRRLTVPITVNCTTGCQVNASLTVRSRDLRGGRSTRPLAIGAVRERIFGNALQAGSRPLSIVIRERYRSNLRRVRSLRGEIRVTSTDAQGLTFVDAKQVTFR
jgi:Domain of unknown function (DUF4394)